MGLLCSSPRGYCKLCGGFAKLVYFLVCTWFGFAHLAKGAVPAPPAVYIRMQVVHETFDGVIMTWNSSLAGYSSSTSCLLYYKAIQDKSVQPSSMSISSSPSLLTVNGLDSSLNYSAYIICEFDTFIYPSNTVLFSPRRREGNFQPENFLPYPTKEITPTFLSESNPPQPENNKTIKKVQLLEVKQPAKFAHKSFISNSSSKPPTKHKLAPVSLSDVDRKSVPTKHKHITSQSPDELFPPGEELPLNDSVMDHEGGPPARPPVRPSKGGGRDEEVGQKEIVMVIKERHMESLRRDPHRSSPPSSVILGAICGVVGFLIINVTVVMVVRLYSLRRARRRQFLEMQLQQNDGYIFNIDEFINA